MWPLQYFSHRTLAFKTNFSDGLFNSGVESIASYYVLTLWQTNLIRTIKDSVLLFCCLCWRLLLPINEFHKVEINAYFSEPILAAEPVFLRPPSFLRLQHHFSLTCHPPSWIKFNIVTARTERDTE